MHDVDKGTMYLQFKLNILIFNGFVDIQEVDFAVGAFTITKERLEAVNFLSPFWEEPSAMMIKMPDDNKFNMYMRPFHVSKDFQ